MKKKKETEINPRLIMDEKRKKETEINPRLELENRLVDDRK